MAREARHHKPLKPEDDESSISIKSFAEILIVDPLFFFRRRGTGDPSIIHMSGRETNLL